jgi:hypothetical protein
MLGTKYAESLLLSSMAEAGCVRMGRDVALEVENDLFLSC